MIKLGKEELLKVNGLFKKEASIISSTVDVGIIMIAMLLESQDQQAHLALIQNMLVILFSKQNLLKLQEAGKALDIVPLSRVQLANGS
jgi:hypothetical protein